MLEKAIERVTGMLIRKKDIWTHGQDVYVNFDINKEIGIDPIKFGVAMCNLKMNRLRTRLNDHQVDNANDLDLEDTLVDIASYAILTLGLVYRERERSKTISHDHSDALLPRE